MKIKIKKLHPDAKMPKRGTKYAAGFDLYAAEEFDAPIFEEQTVRIQTGLAFEIPEGYVGVVYSRSSTALKGLIITPLLVDADYRGPVYITVKNASGRPYIVHNGDRIAQMRIEKGRMQAEKIRIMAAPSPNWFDAIVCAGDAHA